MWTPSIKSVVRSDDRVIMNAEFSNGTTSFEKPFSFGGTITKEQIYAALKSAKLALESQDTATATLATDAVILPADEPTPTQAEIDRNNWLALYRKWVRVKTTLIDTGIFTGNETAAVNLKSQVQSGFKAAYLDYI